MLVVPRGGLELECKGLVWCKLDLRGSLRERVRWAMSLRLNTCKSALLVEMEMNEQDQRLTATDEDPRLWLSELDRRIRVDF